MVPVIAQIFFWTGNIYDWYTTKRIILDRERGKELNPLFAWIIKKVEKPGKDDMVDLGFLGKMHKAEIIMLLFKIAMGLMLYGFFIPAIGIAPVAYFWWAGAAFWFIALSNKYNWLGKIMNKWRNR